MLKALSLALLLSAMPAFAQDKVVAKVNGIEIKESDMIAAEEEIGQNAQQLPADQKREFVLNFLIDMQLASKAAEAKGLGGHRTAAVTRVEGREAICAQ